MSGVRLAVAAFLLLLATAGEASGAGTARLQVFPEQPRAGEAAVVQLRTFVLLEGTPPVVYSEDYPWSVAAYSATGRRVRIRLARTPSDPYLWAAVVRFPTSGRWLVCVLNFQFLQDPDQGCSVANPRQLPVRVRASTSPVDLWHRLQRPLRVPSIARGASCPATATDVKGDLGRIGYVGVAWGEGPAYPAGLGSAERPVLSYLDPIPPNSLFFGSRWFGNKVLWVVDPSYRGPVLVRGRQLDGPNEIRFERGPLPPRELRIAPLPSVASASARDRPSFTRVRAPGCYAYQVDGVGFSYLLVFEAEPL